MNQSINIATAALANPPSDLQATINGASVDARKAIADAKAALGDAPVPHRILSDAHADDAKLQVGTSLLRSARGGRFRLALGGLGGLRDELRGRSGDR